MSYEKVVILLCLFLGICFGFATFSNRHLFSEGPDKEKKPEQASVLEGRTFWIMICTWLWPILVFTGINSAVILAKRKKLASTKI
ncbi:MAG: hypothetical protein RIR68_1968 [Pseudomonadota bacterium]